MPVLRNIRLLITGQVPGLPGVLESIPKAAVAWTGELLDWIGAEVDLPGRYAGETSLDAGSGLVIPGLIDCHTHLAFGGWRDGEFVLRSRGASYLEIARSGGGIRATVEATRRIDEEALLERCLGFLKEMAGLGVTTVECKSGYGLDLETELKILEVYRAASEAQPVRVVPTLLAAHALPAEFQDRREDYVDFVCRSLIPTVSRRGLARFCDVFVEEGAFTAGEARKILETAADWGLPGKLHAEQLSDSGGAVLAGDLNAASADHLEQVSDEGVRALVRGGVTAVVLPLASLYLRQPPVDGRRLIDAGVSVAIATDFNPGSAPCYHLPLAMTLACVQSGMTPSEALIGATSASARALGLEGEVGTLAVGKSADFAILDAADPDQWLYHFRPNACRKTFVRGREVEGAKRLEFS
jgi:imidazolonepropionase